MEKPKVTADEVEEARQWWMKLDNRSKGSLSIYTLLALYAKHWAEKHTVRFDSDEKVAEIGRR